jgi:hypothetical protein
LYTSLGAELHRGKPGRVQRTHVDEQAVGDADEVLNLFKAMCLYPIHLDFMLRVESNSLKPQHDFEE